MIFTNSWYMGDGQTVDGKVDVSYMVNAIKFFLIEESDNNLFSMVLEPTPDFSLVDCKLTTTSPKLF